MIDPSLFTVESLIRIMLDNCGAGVKSWRTEAEILQAYVAPFECQVRLGRSFLRYSKGPKQGLFWDCYGDDFHTPTLALLALSQAPPPPWMVMCPRPEAKDA